MNAERLFDPGPADHGLTPRQAVALAAIRATGLDGLTTDELGQILHADRHNPRELCAFCGSAGLTAGRALRDRQLVRQRKRKAPGGDSYMVWVDVDARPARVERDYQLPEGF